MRTLLLFFIFIILSGALSAQEDTVNTINVTDSIASIVDSPAVSFQPKSDYFAKLGEVIAGHRFLNSKSKPLEVAVTEHRAENKNFLFYAICATVLFFALLKTFYSRYFDNIFRVFFNTSLRQSQITDQLIQAKLPSLLFNIFFVITGGFYIFLLLSHLGHLEQRGDIKILLACIGVLTIIYCGKYIILKFTGWISGYRNEANTYIFIIFLINKIIAVVLVPIVIIMAFSQPTLARFVVMLSYLIIMLMLVLRFFRSYGVLQNRIHVQRFHFFLYIIGIEILPLLLIYKSTLNLLKNYL